MQDFRNLTVWSKSHELALDIYRCSASFPRTEVYGMTSQIRRAAASVPANIAEGVGRNGDPEFHRFLRIAMGSACETEYHLILAHDLGFLPTDRYESLNAKVNEVKKMLVALMARLARRGKSF